MKLVPYLLLILIFFIVLNKCSYDTQENNKQVELTTQQSYLTSNSSDTTTQLYKVIVDATISTYLDYSKKLHYYFNNANSKDNLALFNPLIKRLSKYGYKKKYLDILFSNPNVFYIPYVLDVNLGYTYKMGELNKYLLTGLSPSWLKGSVDGYKDLLTLKLDKFEDVSKRYGVSPEAILSIMWIESAFGLNFGRHSVFNIYASMALFLEDELTTSATKYFMAQYNLKSDKDTRKMVLSKANWAFKELLNLLKINELTHIEILSLRGSFAGAFGFAQFIPSSYIKLAKDGNGDKHIDLFNIDDAIESIANYLKSAGWNSNDQRSKANAILAYNHSIPYLIDVATKMKIINPDSVVYIPKFTNDAGSKTETKDNATVTTEQKVELNKELKKQFQLNNLLQ